MLSVNVVRDSAAHLPDFAYYHIRGLARNSSSPGVPDKVQRNDCSNYGTIEIPLLPSTLGFQPCQVATKAFGGGPTGGRLQNDLCICERKSGNDLPDLPVMRNDLIERKGFCLKYSIF